MHLPPNIFEDRLSVPVRQGLVTVDVTLGIVEIVTRSLLRGLLVETDMVTVLFRHKIHYEDKKGILAALPFDLDGARRPIGITRRSHSSMAPAADLLVKEIREVAREIEPSL